MSNTCKICKSSKCNKELTQREKETSTSFGLRSTCDKHCRGQVIADVAEQKHQLLVKEKDNCQGCGKQLIQRPKEPNRMFLKRENCGKSCANRARGINKHKKSLKNPFNKLMNTMTVNQHRVERPYN